MIWYFDRAYLNSRYISHYFIHLFTKEEFMVFSSSFWGDNISGRAIDSESASLKDLSKDQHSLSLSLIYIDNFHHDIQVKPYLAKRKWKSIFIDCGTKNRDLRMFVCHLNRISLYLSSALFSFHCISLLICKIIHKTSDVQSPSFCLSRINSL